MYLNQANKCLTGEVRLSYVHLAAPWTNPQQQNAEPKYCATLLIPKTDTATHNDILSAIAAATETAVDKKWNGVKPPVVPNPLHDGDGVRQDGTPFGEECKGMWVITASNKLKPWVCDISNPNVELGPTDSYSGMWARCTIHFYGYCSAGKKGIGCSLDGVMKVRDDESLGGAVKPTANEFAQFAQKEPRINPITGQPM